MWNPSKKKDNDIIVIGETLKISLKEARLWSSKNRVPDQVLKKELITRNLTFVTQIAINEGDFRGIGQLVKYIPYLSEMRQIPKQDKDKLNIFARFALPKLYDLIYATMKEEISKVLECISGLVGLGVGLTPSGDDVIGGFIASIIFSNIYLGVRDTNILKLCDLIPEVIKGKTNTFSQKLVEYATKGEISEPLRDLIETIFTTTKEDTLIKATRRVLSIGSTSGTDLILGVLLGLIVILKKQHKSRK